MARPSQNFFEIFNKDSSSDRLKLPTALTLDMLGTPELMVSLRDKYGNHWPMKLPKIDSVLYFKEGWTKFVEDNFIENGDFMFFQFDGDKVFDVKITGLNGCDSEGVGGPMSKETMEEHREVEIVDVEMEERENQPLEQLDEEIEEGDDDNEETEEGDNEDEEMQVGDDEEQEENLPISEQVKRDVAKLRKEVKSLARRIGKPKSYYSNRIKNCNFPQDSWRKRARAKAPDPCGTDIFKSGILPQPKNPYFVTKIRPKRLKELYMPVNELRHYSIQNLPEQATLRDSCGRTWPTKLTRWVDGQKAYVGGWRSFCRVNSVGEEDLCVCELLREGDKQDLVIQVQVVPTGDNAISSRDQQID